MVGEFPELQGHMGRAYALAQGEAREVADAIRDHYKPTGAQDDVAPGDVSAAVALADRFDTLAGCFAVGLAPTGAADPFALRRACIAALRTMLDRGYGALSFSEMVGLAYDGLEGKKLDLSIGPRRSRKIEEFATERLRGLLASATSGAVADAVMSGAGPLALRSVVAVQARARALAGGGGREGALARQGADRRQAPRRASAARHSPCCTRRVRFGQLEERRRRHPEARARSRRRDRSA